MRTLMLLILAALLTITLAVPAMSQDAKLVTTPCLPPGVSPEVLSWPTIDANLVQFSSQSGIKYVGLTEILGNPTTRQMVQVYWVRGRIVFFDPNPNDQDAPAWYDAGLTDGKVFYDNPTGQCQWKRLPIPPSPEQTPPPATPPAKPSGPTTQRGSPTA